MLNRNHLSLNDQTEYLKAVGSSKDRDISITDTALTLAAIDRESNSIDRYKDHLKRLVLDTDDLLMQIEDAGGKPSLTDILTTIETVLYDVHGYSGDKASYDHLDNANLIAVIERRKGLPIVLGILYLHIANSLSDKYHLGANGLNFPGHFLIKVTLKQERVIIDPFDRGKVRDTPWLRSTLKSFMSDKAELRTEFTQAVSNRSILIRLQNNIKVRLIEAEEPDKALKILENMLLFAPNEAVLWRETGMLQAFLNNILAAIETLEHYLMIEEDPRGHPEAVHMLQQLKTQLH